MSNKTVVVLFTRDLRVHDHPALWHACATAHTVVPLFVLDPSFAARPTMSGNRSAFLGESLADLRRSLRARGADLFIRTGRHGPRDDGGRGPHRGRRRPADRGRQRPRPGAPGPTGPGLHRRGPPARGRARVNGRYSGEAVPRRQGPLRGLHPLLAAVAGGSVAARAAGATPGARTHPPGRRDGCRGWSNLVARCHRGDRPAARRQAGPAGPPGRAGTWVTTTRGTTTWRVTARHA